MAAKQLCIIKAFEVAVFLDEIEQLKELKELETELRTRDLVKDPMSDERFERMLKIRKDIGETLAHRAMRMV